MADGDGCVPAKEHHGHGLAYDVAPAHDNGLLAREVDAGRIDEPHHAKRRAWLQQGVAYHEASHVVGVEAVDVL